MLAVALMQNLSPADAVAMYAELDAIKTKSVPDNTKALLLGLTITDVVSTSVLVAAKESLGDSILNTTKAADQSEPKLNGDVEPIDKALEDLVAEPEGRFASEGLPQTPQTPG
jgi:hypothetical protein